MQLLTASTLEPVTVEEAKASARVDGPEWDEIIAGNIRAARQVAEHEIGRPVMAQTWRFELADWPLATDVLQLHRPSTVVVSYWTGSAWTTPTSTGFAWAAVQGGFGLVPALGAEFPALGEVAIGSRVRIDATSGAATAADADECVKTFIKALVTVMVHDPALTAHDAAGSLLLRMLDPVRVYA